MSTARNLQVARRWFEELWSVPALDIADEIVDPCYAPHWVQIEAKGPAQIKHEIRYFRSVFPDLRYEIIDSVAEDNRVWVRYKASGTHRGAAWGFEATGRQATFEGVTIFYLNSDGKIVDRWSSFCFYDLFMDLGLVPPFWELSQHFKQQ